MQPEMKYIYTVYQCGSFSKAAEKLFLTQPALSISVQKAEHEVGMPLFNRDKKPLELTEAGMIYIQKIEQIQHLEQELAMQLNELCHQVMAVDTDEERVNECMPFVTNAQLGDSTRVDFLRSLGVRN